MQENDTIAAYCTAPGGALSILRISGPDALSLAEKVWTGRKKLTPADPRRLTFGHVLREDGTTGETCLAVYMPSPASYTGEDVVELQCHGGTLSPKRLLENLFRHGARPAGPGEFTKRAFLNGKMDLSQAEAVAELISARSETAFRLAEKQLSGVLGNRIRSVRAELSHLLAELESHLDFPEENLDWKAPEELIKILRTQEAELKHLLSGRESTALLRDGVRLVIAGSPNTGKSSLLNLLLGYDRAIVSDIPGTTRDTLQEQLLIRGIPVSVTDTAGLRENARDTVEKLGIERSRSSLEAAEIVFWMFDSAHPADEEIARMKESIPAGARVIAVWNKSDLASDDFLPPETGTDSVLISVKERAGVDALLDTFERKVWEGTAGKNEPECAVSARQGAALEESLQFLEPAIREIEQDALELAAENVRLAMAPLGTVTGETVRTDVLDEIFSRFCIGK